MNEDDSERSSPTKLGEGWADRGAALVRVLGGLVPFAGPLVAEVVTEIIPRQRIDRVESFVKELAARLASKPVF